MPTDNSRIRQLAARALELANNDIAAAVRIMSELTGLGFAEAFDAIDEVMPLIAERRRKSETTR